MRCMVNPCKRQHDYTDYYGEGLGGCGTPYCDGPTEYHCRKCGYYVMRCACGSCNGFDTVPYHVRQRLEKRQEEQK